MSEDDKSLPRDVDSSFHNICRFRMYSDFHVQSTLTFVACFGLFFFFPSFSLLQISLFFSSFFFLVALHLVSVALVRLLLAAGRPSGASKKRRLSQLGPALTVRLSCSGDEVKHFLEFSFSFWRQDPIFDWMNIQAYPDAVGEVQQAHHMQHWTLISTNYTIIRQG